VIEQLLAESDSESLAADRGASSDRPNSGHGLTDGCVTGKPPSRGSDLTGRAKSSSGLCHLTVAARQWAGNLRLPDRRRGGPVGDHG
jgi:hypothetical protein